MADTLCVRDLSVLLSEKSVLHALNFEVPPAQIFGILGPNGAGKTTLLKAITGLIPYQGEITYAGRSLSALDPKARARTIALVPQRSELNVALASFDVVAQGRYCHHNSLDALNGADRNAIEAAMHATTVSDLAQVPFTQLSGGEQRRVLLARALATEAPLILLDEPASSLDVAHALTLFQHLRQLSAAGRTVVVVLHDLNDAKTWCNSLLLLSQGKVAACGTAAQVITAANVRAVYGVELTETTALGYSRIGGSL